MESLEKVTKPPSGCLSREVVSFPSAVRQGIFGLTSNWEWEVVIMSLATCLAYIQDPIMVVVYKYQQLWAEKSSYSLLLSTNKILQETGNAAVIPENPALSWKKVTCELQKAQEAQLISKAASKQQPPGEVHECHAMSSCS